MTKTKIKRSAQYVKETKLIRPFIKSVPQKDLIIGKEPLLARQGLDFRGHTDKASKLSQFLRVRASDVSQLSYWLQRTKYKWISHEIINEIEMIAFEIVRFITTEIWKVKYFLIILDETSDICNGTVFIVCLIGPIVTTFQIEEYFLGFQGTNKTSKTLFKVVCDMSTTLDLLINDLRGQFFDGASNHFVIGGLASRFTS